MCVSTALFSLSYERNAGLRIRLGSLFLNQSLITCERILKVFLWAIDGISRCVCVFAYITAFPLIWVNDTTIKIENTHIQNEYVLRTRRHRCHRQRENDRVLL